MGNGKSCARESTHGTPDIESEIDRHKRREQQTRYQAKCHWIEQIDGRLEVGDYEGCLELLRNADIEFPNDNELSEIEKLARQGVDRRAQAQLLLLQGQELCAKGAFDEGLSLLRQAHKMDERNPAVRAALLANLTQRARALVDSELAPSRPPRSGVPAPRSRSPKRQKPASANRGPKGAGRH